MSVLPFVLAGWVALSLLVVVLMSLVLRGRARFNPELGAGSDELVTVAAEGAPARRGAGSVRLQPLYDR